MASSTTAPRLRSLYRALLRELPPRARAAGRSPLHQRLRASFARPGPDPGLGAAHADQYLQYVRAQRVYVTLLERYNPGMNMDEEERVRLTARRVGMDLPAEFVRGGEQK